MSEPLSRESRIISQARELANNFASQRISELEEELLKLHVSVEYKSMSEEKQDKKDREIFGKYLALAYARGYIDGDSGKKVTKLYV